VRIMRRTLSACTLGMICWESNAERRAGAMQDRARAAKRTAKADSRRAAAEAELLRAQIDAVRQQGGPPTA
jgi:hypothetical protein